MCFCNVARDLAVRNIVILSPHAYNTMRNDYPAYGGNFKVLHYTQMLRDLVRKRALDPARGFEAIPTYHDPCFLGRWNGEYDAPRTLCITPYLESA
jgi:Fe-S oxidoreductase